MLRVFFALCAALLLLGCSVELPEEWQEAAADHRLGDGSSGVVLVLDLDGVIVDGAGFLKHLRRNVRKRRVKAVVVRINSPGGSVGASQEIFEELKYVRDSLKKPVVAACRSVAASGAYYAALGADQIVTNKGALLGSIGVLAKFADFTKLYDWMKVDFFAVTSGRFKDSGNPYRGMRPDERLLFQELIDETYEQFKKDVQEQRKLGADVVRSYADGRVFTGKKAVDLGFADVLGTFADAVRLAASLAKMPSEDPKIFIPKEPRSVWREAFGLLNRVPRLWGGKSGAMDAFLKLRLDLLGQPLYLMPGV